MKGRWTRAQTTRSKTISCKGKDKFGLQRTVSGGCGCARDRVLFGLKTGLSPGDFPRLPKTVGPGNKNKGPFQEGGVALETVFCLGWPSDP